MEEMGNSPISHTGALKKVGSIEGLHLPPNLFLFRTTKNAMYVSSFPVSTLEASVSWMFLVGTLEAWMHPLEGPLFGCARFGTAVRPQLLVSAK